MKTSIHQLYQSHLQNLRDHFGRMYQYTLDNSQGTLTDEQRKVAARRAEEGFTKSAFDSMPQICRHPDGELCNEMAALYSCVEALRGLLEDMYAITEALVLGEEEWDDIMDTAIESETSSQDGCRSLFKEKIGLRQLIKGLREKRRAHGPSKWYERWAGKVLIIGLNYIQGWIALQTLRREATKRDQDLPKFPLF